MFKKLAKLIASASPSSAPATPPREQARFEQMLAAIKQGSRSPQNYYVSYGQNEAYQEMRKGWPLREKQQFVYWLVGQSSYGLVRILGREWSRRSRFACEVLEALLGTALIDTEHAALKLGRLFLTQDRYQRGHLEDWPVAKYLRQLERLYKKTLSPGPEMRKLLREYADQLQDKRQLTSRIHILLGEEVGLQPFKFTEEGDHFGAPMNALVETHFPAGELLPVLHHAATAKTGKPSKKWWTSAAAHLEALDQERARVFFASFLELLRATAPLQSPTKWYDQYVFLAGMNADPVKGLLWMASYFNVEAFSRQLVQVAVAAYKKVPNKGPLDTKTGNACVTALSLTEGIHGISQLASLAYRIKQSGIRKKVNEILRQVAEEKQVSRQEIEDLSVLEFGLADDLLSLPVGEYSAEIQLVKPGKSVLRWRKGEKLQKSVPKAVKEQYPDLLKNVKATKKSLETDSINLRDRIDWGLRLNRDMTLEYFTRVWEGNSLLSYFGNRLIWVFQDAAATRSVAAIRGASGWEDASGKPVVIEGMTRLRLWHPALSSIAEVEQWRAYLEAREIAQPFKQAFREVYLLTPPEETTRTYSNRMAAHILKQHQFATLARGRGWTYSLIGAYDHGMPTQACYQNLDELGIRAEYIIQELQQGDNFNETGIWYYVGTDQIRFLDLTRQGEQLELAVIPPVVFSEILRDTDLFTGVASIGNDDQWSDSGEDVFRNYWENYTTRDLTGMGQNRKLALERLIPRLKIRDVATVDDKYVRVRGKIRNYKIHIGSGNILMEPNDQYLCIVPATYSPFKSATDKLYLPFEGDRTLSIIISKALLLAADDEITDRTIVRQLKW